MTTDTAPTQHPLDIRRFLPRAAAGNGAAANNAGIRTAHFVTLMIPLLALAFCVQALGIEARLQLPELMWIATAGFALHCWLPLNYRLPFFLLLNAVALVLLTTPMVAVGTLAFGLLLVIVASLKIAMGYRVVMVLGLGGYLACVKSGVVGGAAMFQVSGILGGLFMFRTALYLYEIQHEKQPASWWQRLSYFFLLPNLIFQLFPIVDYKGFVRGYYSKPATDVYRKGVHWIAIGVLHLITYRIIYSYCLVPLDDIRTLPTLLQHLIFSYALIVRLSGIFHLSAGLVCLFGFDLPRTFHNYFLASSFSDIWHRINSYWRAFVMKLFYMPIYFRLRHLGVRAVFLSVILVFIINFFLHSYQWFWIRGSFQITETDILFWAILGVLLAGNSVLLAVRGNRSAQKTYSHRGALIHSLKVLGMFSFMCVMWSMWTSGSLAAWLRVLKQVASPTGAQLLWLAAAAAALMAVGVVCQFFLSTRAGRQLASWRSPLASPTFTAVFFLGLSALPAPAVVDAAQNYLSVNLHQITSETLNIGDEELLSQGYYEELIVPNGLTSRVWEVEVERDASYRSDQAKKGKSSREASQREKELPRYNDRNTLWGELTGLSKNESLRLKATAPEARSWIDIKKSDLMTRRKDAIEYRYKPNISVFYRGEQLMTNEFGMRDRPYTLEKGPSTYRVAYLGGSPEVALGTPEDGTTDNLLEDRLTAEGQFGDYETIEFLNFAAGQYTLLSHMAITEKLIEQFQPDAVLVHIHHVNVQMKVVKHVAKGLRRGTLDEYPYLLALADKVGLDQNTSADEAVKLLTPYGDELTFWTLQRIASFCEQRKIRLVVVYMGVLTQNTDVRERSRATVLGYLKANDFNVLDLSYVFEDSDRPSLVVAPWDYHPNAEAQAIVAEQMYQEIMSHQEYFLDADSIGDAAGDTP